MRLRSSTRRRSRVNVWANTKLLGNQRLSSTLLIRKPSQLVDGRQLVEKAKEKRILLLENVHSPGSEKDKNREGNERLQHSC